MSTTLGANQVSEVVRTLMALIVTVLECLTVDSKIVVLIKDGFESL